MRIPSGVSTSAESLAVRPLSSEQVRKLQIHKQHFMDLVLPHYHSLLAFQTPVKSQNKRGSCPAFALIGAVEAHYRRDYGVTLDLSEEYLIHITHSMRHAYNPDLHHENISSHCGILAVNNNMIGDEIFERLPLPLEEYAPYFGVDHAALDQYGTLHSDADLLKLVQESGIQCDKTDDEIHWQYLLSQEAIDNYEYDPRHIPLAARKNCRYMINDLIFLDTENLRDTTFLETALVGVGEIIVSCKLWRIDVGNGTLFDDLTPVPKHPQDGNPIATYPKVGINEDVSDPENPNAPGVAGHRMLICGYDHDRELFLLKNSWGGYLPYFWVPYKFIKEVGLGGLIVTQVSDPNLEPDQASMWLGRWYFTAGNETGRLILRRPGSLPFSAPNGKTLDRLGTYYDSQNVPHTVFGNLINESNSDWEINLYIDLDNVEGPPDSAPLISAQLAAKIANIQQFSCKFAGSMDSETYGDYARGTTVGNGGQQDVYLSRHPKQIQYEWRWCRKCQGLFFNKYSRGVCKAGGTHDLRGSANYGLTITHMAAHTQNDWRWCKKCQGLFFGRSELGVCPAKGSHDMSDSGDYCLTHGAEAVGQHGWHRCSKCLGLFYSERDMGVCPAGGEHDVSGNTNYALTTLIGASTWKQVEVEWEGVWDKGWTHIAPFQPKDQDEPHFAAYNRTTGAAAFIRLNLRNGGRRLIDGCAVLPEQDWESGWTSLAPFSGKNGVNYLLLYNKNTDNNNVRFDRIKTDLTGITHIKNGSWAAGWNHIATVKAHDINYLIVYNNNTGRVRYDRIKTGGAGSTNVQDGNWAKGWNQLKAFNHSDLSLFLVYDKQTGRLRINQFYGESSENLYDGSILPGFTHMAVDEMPGIVIGYDQVTGHTELYEIRWEAQSNEAGFVETRFAGLDIIFSNDWIEGCDAIVPFRISFDANTILRYRTCYLGYNSESGKVSIYKLAD